MRLEFCNVLLSHEEVPLDVFWYVPPVSRIVISAYEMALLNQLSAERKKEFIHLTKNITRYTV